MVPSRDPYGTTARPRKPSRVHEGRPVPCLTILSHPNPERIGDRVFPDLDGAMRLARNTPDFVAPDRRVGAPLDDPFVSRKPLALVAQKSGDVALERGESPTELVVDGRRLDRSIHTPRDALSRGVTLVLADRVVLLLHLAKQREALPEETRGILGFNDRVLNLRREIDRVAGIKTPVLLRGPSGTGKELTAAAIHAGGTGKRPFVSVNMAAIAPNLAAAELFGAERGSFTGADRAQIGFFRRAEGGTLFLDEVGETPIEVQGLLLRALETGEIVPVGAQRSVPVRFRLIAATDADLEALMDQDSFKKALFHRLAGYEIHLPSLRERRDDLGRLFLHFVRAELAEIGESKRLKMTDPFAEPLIPAALMVRLTGYDWPGNVRQLRNTVRQIVIGSLGEPCLKLPSRIEAMLTDDGKDDQKTKPADLREDEVVAVMRANRWELKASADALGISRGSLYALIRESDRLRTAGDLTEEQIREALRRAGGDIAMAVDDLEVSDKALRRRIVALGIGSG